MRKIRNPKPETRNRCSEAESMGSCSRYRNRVWDILRCNRLAVDFHSLSQLFLISDFQLGISFGFLVSGFWFSLDFPHYCPPTQSAL
jgi:hypothetical protein